MRCSSWYSMLLYRPGEHTARGTHRGRYNCALVIEPIRIDSGVHVLTRRDTVVSCARQDRAKVLRSGSATGARPKHSRNQTHRMMASATSSRCRRHTRSAGHIIWSLFLVLWRLLACALPNNQIRIISPTKKHGGKIPVSDIPPPPALFSKHERKRVCVPG